MKTRTQNIRDGLAIGRIVSSKSDVRHRRQEDVIWSQIEENLEIKSGDGIFTGKQSTATVELGQQKRIELMPDSMVLFQESAQEVGKQIIEVKRGGFKGRLAPDTVLKIGNKMITSKNSALIDIASDKTTSEMKVTVEEGTLDLEDPQGKALVIQKAETISVSEEKDKNIILKTPFELLSPRQGEITILGNKEKQVKLEWLSNSGTKKVKIILSQSPAFDSRVKTYLSEDSTFLANDLKEGQWYWKVADLQSQEGYSQESVIRSFEVTHLPVPVLISPYENKTFSFLENQTSTEIPVTPITKKLNSHQKIEVSISRRDTLEPTIGYQVDANELKNIQVSEAGTYSVKIRNILSDQQSQWSNEIKFTVNLPVMPVAQVPTVEVAPPETVAQEVLEEALPKPLVLDWKENHLSQEITYLIPAHIQPIVISWQNKTEYKYKLQISNDEQFETLLLDKYVDGSEHVFSPQMPGKYYSRIRAEKSETQYTNWYQYSTIQAKSVYPLKAESYLTPKAKQVIIEGEPTTFSWTEVQNADKYFIILSSTTGHVQEKVITATKSEIKEHISPDRKYNWSVYYSDNGNTFERNIAVVNTVDLIKAEQTSTVQAQEFVTYLRRNRFTSSFSLISGVLSQTGSSTLKPTSIITGLNIDLIYRRKMERENWFSGLRLSATQYKSTAQSSYTLTGEVFAEKHMQIYSFNGKFGAGIGSLTHPVVDISSSEKVYAISDFYVSQYFGINYELGARSSIDAELRAQERIDDPANSYFVSPRISYQYTTNRGVYGAIFAYKTFNSLINLNSGKVPGYRGTLGSAFQESMLGFSYQFSY